MRNFRTDIVLCIFLILIGLAVYQHIYRIPFIWDDLHLIVSNDYLHDFNNIKKVFLHDLWHIESRDIGSLSMGANYYRPLVNMTYFIDYRLWGLNPRMYHLWNFVFHLIAALFVYLICKRVFLYRWWAFIAAGIFLTHPMQTEAVSWISGRTDVFAVAFIMGALYSHLRMRETGTKWYMIGAFVFFLLGLFSKENAILFPLLLIVYDRFVGDKRFKLVYFKEFIGYFVIIIFYLILRLNLFNYIGTDKNIGGYSERLAVSFNQITQYLRMLILPVRQHLDYVVSYSLGELIISSLVVLFIAGLVLIIWRKYRVITFGLIWILTAISLVLAINPFIDIIVYEHFLYLSMVGFSIMLAGVLINIFKRYSREYSLVCGFAIIAIYGLMSYSRNLLWEDPADIWRRSYIVESRSSTSAYNAAWYAQEYKKDFGIAEYFYKEAIKNEPGKVLAWLNWGYIYQARGDFEKASRIYLKNIKRNNDRLSYINLGICRYFMHDYSGAVSVLNEAKGRNPEEIILIDEFLGKAYYELEKFPDAMDCFKKVLNMGSGGRFEIWRIMGKILYKEGNLEESAGWYSKALEAEPNDMVLINSLGYIYMKLGRIEEAEKYFHRVLSINPEDFYAHLYLAEVYLNRGDLLMAKGMVEFCSRSNPEEPELVDIEGKIREAETVSKSDTAVENIP